MAHAGAYQITEVRRVGSGKRIFGAWLVASSHSTRACTQAARPVVLVTTVHRAGRRHTRQPSDAESQEGQALRMLVRVRMAEEVFVA